MSKQNVHLTAGELVSFSVGEYSDYGYAGTFVALQSVSDAEMRALADEVKSSEEYAKIGVYCGHDVLISAMIRRGWLLSVNMHVIHLGSYGEIDLS